eukprot:CAMPEP_0194533888 /NCGR_PEP_ID=MMETSP0253-20130528/71878_1 /TAXON_ID=2966 /ORGANISM="Noctiluca scintillans" /LENGTH=601 /DNA_ID=CAMNT_0039379475 /DNA_START=105 /DNA_END=1910 /DNA_ORIENTATION=-
MRLKSHTSSGQLELCLSLHSPGVHRDDAPVVAVRCDSVSTYSDMADFWRLDRQGLLLSGLSGKCVHGDPEIVQASCSSTVTRWALLENGTLSSLDTEGQCMSIQQPIVLGNATDAYSLSLQSCADAISWVQETSNLVVYPVPDSSWVPYASPHYSVTVEQGSNAHTLFVYSSEPQDGEPLQGLSNSYATFSFSGTVTVYVEMLSQNISSATLRPLEYGLTPVLLDSTTISFELSTVDAKISVEFDSHWQTDALLIFADALETDTPGPQDPDVVYRGVGTYYDNFFLDSHTTVYLAGGAFVFANQAADNIFDSGTDSTKENITIRGRGVVSSKLATGAPYMITLCGNSHMIEGITLVAPAQQSILQINAPWACDGGWSGVASGGVVRGVKLMGWNFADGIYAGRGSHVYNVFTKVNDDGVKPFETDSLFENNVHWQQGNGWAIMVAWLTEGHQTNIVVRNTIVIHDMHDNDYPVYGCDPCIPNQATIGIVQGGSGSISNVMLENIVIEDRVLRPVWMGVDTNYWGQSGAGTVTSVTLKDIYVPLGGREDSQLFGTSSGQFTDVTLNNFVYKETVLERPNFHFNITDVPDVQIVVPSADEVVV